MARRRLLSAPGRLLALLAVLLAFPPPAIAWDPAAEDFWQTRAPDGSPIVRLHFFWSAKCPHCRAARPFVDTLPQRLPWVEVVSHELTSDRANVGLYVQAARVAGGEARSVPGFVFCRRMETGFHTVETTGANLLRVLEACHAEITAARPYQGPATVTAASPVTETYASDRSAATIAGRAAGSGPVEIPVLGSVELERWSLPLLTLTLAGLDAFNPCAFFVLLFLLSLLVHARSRARMLVIGGVFVLFSGLVYFAFMAAWLNVFLWLGELQAITAGAGLLAVVIGAINTKDYFYFRRGVSLSIPEAAKPGLFRRMREIATSGSLGPMLVGTVLLAIVANSYELLCTAGFPMVYTRALTLHDLGTVGYYGYVAIYNVIYVVPLALIVLAFTYTMGSRKLSEHEGRLLKLVSGYMMLGLGLVLLAAPDLLVNALASLAVLASALLAAALTVALTRKAPG